VEKPKKIADIRADIQKVCNYDEFCILKTFFLTKSMLATQFCKYLQAMDPREEEHEEKPSVRSLLNVNPPGQFGQTESSM
jgi:hypothetical protein